MRTPALRPVALTITPTYRELALDARDGARSWSLRLAPSERRLRVSDVRLFRSEDSDDEDEGIRKIGRRERGGRGSKDLTRARKKGEVERVGRVKRPPPRRVRLDKSDVECRGRGRWEVTLCLGSGAREVQLSGTRVT